MNECCFFLHASTEFLEWVTFLHASTEAWPHGSYYQEECRIWVHDVRYTGKWQLNFFHLWFACIWGSHIWRTCKTTADNTQKNKRRKILCGSCQLVPSKFTFYVEPFFFFNNQACDIDLWMWALLLTQIICDAALCLSKSVVSRISEIVNFSPWIIGYKLGQKQLILKKIAEKMKIY